MKKCEKCGIDYQPYTSKQKYCGSKTHKIGCSFEEKNRRDKINKINYYKNNIEQIKYKNANKTKKQKEAKRLYDKVYSKTHRVSNSTKHSGLYSVWYDMKTRCYNKNMSRYKDYGGRGIKIEWSSFLDFKKDMYGSYLEHLRLHGKSNTSIDRIDVNGNYCKENCRWATWKEQGNNRRNNVKKKLSPDFIVKH